ncbi:hypothetical protein ABZV80_41005 [Streptomyces sp. NPDC005132]|uniref:hypothetical protein n=1 Tax=Streptomyces sp. NPDC005132 TaxID=3154294 RepID=UPI0033BD4854
MLPASTGRTPGHELRPWRPSEDFTEPCETCHAPAGQYCRPHCDSGYTAHDAQRDAERREQRRADSPPPA